MYVHRLKANPLAKKVKLADLMHNADQARCADAGIDPVKLQHWCEKYRRAQEILMEA